MDKTVRLVYDMQYGSTGKGLLVGKLCHEAKQHSASVSSMAPNAGHTYVAEDDTKFIHSAVPLGVIFPHISTVGIGAGSTLDLEKFTAELIFADDHNVYECFEQRVVIHEMAGVRTDDMLEDDKALELIGSTMKGAGSAQIAKIKRDADIPCIVRQHKSSIPHRVGRFFIDVVTHDEWIKIFDRFEEIIVEGSQGYSLGINSGFHPYCTYRECTPAQILADTAIPCKLSEVQSYGVMRTFPIRVANRFRDGEMVGYSGDAFPDQMELDWSMVGVEPEKTTVTKLERRVFEFSFKQLEQCWRHTRPDHIFLNFANYLEEEELHTLIDGIIDITDATSLMVGFGAKTSNIEERH